MNLSDLQTITSRGEDSRHQFKEDIRNGDSLAAEMVAFSNSHGGFIFIGVSNNGELVGLSSKDVDRINQLISNSASQHVKSLITIHTENISVAADQVEIINPGNLPDHLTIEKIRAGNSIQRNPILASFAAKGLLPYRGLGTGIRRALQDWPQIKFINDQDGCLFTSRLERQKMPNAPINAPITSLQQKILEILKDDPKASYELLESKLCKERTTIMRNIQKMKDMGILRRSGSNKNGFWEIL